MATSSEVKRASLVLQAAGMTVPEEQIAEWSDESLHEAMMWADWAQQETVKDRWGKKIELELPSCLVASMYTGVYEERFSSNEDIASEFAEDAILETLKDACMIFATYTYEDYSGNAEVIFVKDGKIYANSASHCSCDGLEGGWQPNEMSLDSAKTYYKDRWSVIGPRIEYALAQQQKVR